MTQTDTEIDTSALQPSDDGTYRKVGNYAHTKSKGKQRRFRNEGGHHGIYYVTLSPHPRTPLFPSNRQEDNKGRVSIIDTRQITKTLHRLDGDESTKVFCVLNY